MQVKLEWVWEKLDEETSRVRVIGGWLIRSRFGKAETMTFCQDRDHQHVIKSPTIDNVIEKQNLAKDFA